VSNEVGSRSAGEVDFKAAVNHPVSMWLKLTPSHRAQAIDDSTRVFPKTAAPYIKVEQEAVNTTRNNGIITKTPRNHPFLV